MAEFNKLYNPYKELGGNQLRYPLIEPNYKGHIRFTVLNEENTNRKVFDQLTEKLGNAAATLFGKNKEGNLQIEENLEKITSGDPPKSQRDETAARGQLATQQTRRSASRFSPSNRTCLLYLPVGLQFRDNASYSNFDLGVTGAALLAGGGITSGLSTIKDALANTSADKDVATAAAVGLIDEFGGLLEKFLMRMVVGTVLVDSFSVCIFNGISCRQGHQCNGWHGITCCNCELFCKEG